MVSMSRKIRILVVHYLPNMVSGAELAIADFISKADSRFDFTMLTPGEGSLAEFYEGKGFNVCTKRIETPRRRYPGLHTLQSWLFARDLLERRFDAVLCNTFAAASRVGKACRIARIPYAVYVREYISDKTLHRKILERANVIYTPSRDVKTYVSTMTEPNKIMVAYSSIDPDPIYERVASHKTSGTRLLPFESEHPVVSLVGRITPYKQQDLFIRTIPHVLAQVPESRFVVVGSARGFDKAYEEQIKQLASDLNIQDKVRFLGHRKDAVEITSEFTIACMTSDREPLGRTILEAQIIGCVVVAPDTGGPAEIVEDGVDGVLFCSTAPDSEMQLAAQIIRLLKDQDLRCSLIETAKKKVLTTFAGLKHVRQLENYLEDLTQMVTTAAVVK